MQGWFTHIHHLFSSCTLAVNVIHDVSRLRNLTTNDPFEDPQRPADPVKAGEISAFSSEIRARIDLQFHELYG